MREILFRGKRTDNGEWVYGNLLGKEVIVPKGQDFYVECNYLDSGLELYAIDPETVGEYTGLEDKNGKKIFEGDIIENGETYLVKWLKNECAFQLKVTGRWQWGAFTDCLSKVEAEDSKVIGNIYDNPEL